MREIHLNFILTLTVTGILGIKNISPLSSAFATGEGKAGVASGKFYFGDINPANFSALKEFAVGAFLIPSDDSKSYSERAIFSGFGYGKFGLYGAAISASSDGHKDTSLSGGAVGGAFSVTQRLSTGVYFQKIKQNNSGSAGLLYTIPFEKKMIAGLGIFNPNFSISTQYSYTAQPILIPGTSFSFYHTKYFTAFADNAIDIHGEFVKIEFRHSLRFDILNFWNFSAGIHGKDFFRAYTSFIGSAIHINLGILNIGVHSGLASSSSKNLQNSSTNDIYGGFYLQTRFDQIEKIRSIDAGVVTIFEPTKVITPNGDGKNDSLIIHLSHRELTHVKDWNLIILDNKFQTVSVLQPDAISRTAMKIPFPNKLVFSGIKADGSRLPDGEYFFQLVAILSNGDSKKWEIGSILLDANLPSFNMFIETRNVIPDKKPLVIAFKDNLSDMKEYQVSITNVKGEIIFHQVLSSEKEKSFFTWTGYDTHFEPVKPGNYRVYVRGKDIAENTVVKNPEEITVLQKNQECWIEIKEPVFSPNTDRKKDETVISLYSVFKDQIASWKMEIYSENRSTIVKVFSGIKILPETLIWDGKSSKQNFAPDGDYTATFVVKLLDGNIFRSLSYPIRIDKTPPIILLSAQNYEFTPDGDGIDDSINFQVTVEDESQVVAYKLKILNKSGKLVREIAEKNQLPLTMAWDGMQSSGYVADSYETFSAHIEAMDLAGNVGKSNSLSFLTGLIVNKISSTSTLGNSKTKLNFPNIIYPPGSDEPAPESIAILQRLANYLTQNLTTYIEVVGHTDRIGGEKFNEKLSKKRAEFVKKYFTDRGISADKVLTRGAGYSEPLYPESDETSRARNRRIELYLHSAKPK